jgi:hypothetical protein
MSDDSVAEALRSDARLVVVEAPGGCGKTYQGAIFARDAAATIGDGRLLILTHTNAACDVFAGRTRGLSRRVEIRTIHGLITEIAGAYHKAFGLPFDVGAWARREAGGYDQLAAKTATLLANHPPIAACLAKRYPLIICDEHQDASGDQHAIIMCLHAAGARLRIFADPMQQIFSGNSRAEIESAEQRWTSLIDAACRFEELDHPHRWTNGQPALGAWILAARSTLKSGGQLDLTANLPAGLTVQFADNTAQRGAGFAASREQGRPIYDRARAASMLILTGRNDTVTALRTYFARSLPVWEGHVRDGLTALVAYAKVNSGNAEALAAGTVKFMGAVATGFSPTAFGNKLVEEARSGCVASRRGRPELVQSIARHLVESPDHRGVARALERVRDLALNDSTFSDVKIHHARELAEAIQLSRYDCPEEGFAELARRRSHARPALPARAISTIHKAKGLEFDNVMVLPCDRANFGDTRKARAKLYVALSRATHSLMLVVSPSNPSPLLKIS